MSICKNHKSEKSENPRVDIKIGGGVKRAAAMWKNLIYRLYQKVLIGICNG